MKLIIDIPDDTYHMMQRLKEAGMASDAIKIILKGIPVVEFTYEMFQKEKNHE